MKTIDARGLSCPEPVVLCQEAIQSESEFLMLVDTPTQVENIKRFAELKGYSVTSKDLGEEIELHLKK